MLQLICGKFENSGPRRCRSSFSGPTAEKRLRITGLDDKLVETKSNQLIHKQISRVTRSNWKISVPEFCLITFCRFRRYVASVHKNTFSFIEF